MNWGTFTKAERDAAYNNPAAVPDNPALNTAREEASARFRAANPEHLDIRYGPRPRNTMDLFPAADLHAPCIVFIHGGYWQRFDKHQFSNIIAGPHSRGWSAAMLGYTLAPDVTLTEIAAEINTALGWLATNGAVHGIAGPIVLSGWSAGGHLTCLLYTSPSPRDS